MKDDAVSYLLNYINIKMVYASDNNTKCGVL